MKNLSRLYKLLGYKTEKEFINAVVADEEAEFDKLLMLNNHKKRLK